MPVTIAIDGPSGSGKTTIARRVAERLDILHLNTGAMYRAVTLACLAAGVAPDDAAGCTEVAQQVVLEWRHDVDGDRLLLDDTDVTDRLRTPAINDAVSPVSGHPGVRDAMVSLQREALVDGGVAEGRDIGSVVVPDADIKVWLTANEDERIRRRATQLGRDLHDPVVIDEVVGRDGRDEANPTTPMAPADDAWRLDTTDMAIDEVVDAVVDRAAATPATPVAAWRQLPRVAVVGRPNVGKSTLVNRILGRRIAIVEPRPGVTRDRTEHLASWLGRDFVVVDTGGWEHGAQGMNARIVASAEAAVEAADLVLFVTDVTIGVLEDDERYARLLRRSDVDTILVANKADADVHEWGMAELWSLGLDAPHPVSASHGRGVGDLLDVVLARLPDDLGEVNEPDVPRVALVGKPNVGKSSLFNRLLGQERSIVDAVPHTTRDAVDTMVELDDRPWRFVDTAGMRRRYRRGEDTELYSVDRTRDAISAADLVLFLLDASEPLGEQDQRIASLLEQHRRGLVLVVNKWDLVDEQRRHDFERELDRLLAFAGWAPRINISALTGRGVHRVVPTLERVWTQYRRRVPTAQLNELLREVMEATPPPLQAGRTVRIRYLTQAETAPPAFIAFSNRAIPDAYRRFLERRIRMRWGFEGVPIRLAPRLRRSRR